MSVVTPLMWGVVNYNISMPANVTINFCDSNNNCMSGSGTLSRGENQLRVAGSVDIRSAPFTIESINVQYGGNKILEITGVGKLIDYTGTVTVTITELWVVSLPLSMSIDGPTSVTWRVTEGSIAFMNIVRGIPLSGVVVEYYDGTGNKVYTDNSARVSLYTSMATRSCVFEKIETSATSSTSVKVCKLIVKAGDGQTIWRAEAVDQSQCLDLMPSLSLTIQGFTCTSS